MNAVKAGLRFIFAVAGQVEGKDSQGIRRLRGRGWDLDVLWQRKPSVLNHRPNHNVDTLSAFKLQRNILCVYIYVYKQNMHE